MALTVALLLARAWPATPHSLGHVWLLAPALAILLLQQLGAALPHVADLAVLVWAARQTLGESKTVGLANKHTVVTVPVLLGRQPRCGRAKRTTTRKKES
jgi:hypothetical protein